MPSRRNYDHRIRAAIVASGDANLFPELNIPRSTTDTWLRRGAHDVVGVDDDCTALLVRVKRLERQVRVLVQVIRLLLALRRVVPGILDLTRLPDGHKKEQLLLAIDRRPQAASHLVPVRPISNRVRVAPR